MYNEWITWLHASLEDGRQLLHKIHLEVNCRNAHLRIHCNWVRPGKHVEIVPKYQGLDMVL